MEQNNNIMKRSLVLISLLLMISLSTWSQVALDLKIEKQEVDNNQYVKVLLKNISDYHLAIMTSCSWDSAYGGFFDSLPRSYFIIIGNPNKSDSISTSLIVFPGTVKGVSKSEWRVLIRSGETYTGEFPIWGFNYTPHDGLPLDKKGKIKEVQVKVIANYFDHNVRKMVTVEVLSNVLKL